MAKKNLCLKPKYLAEFKCDGSKCGALCCRNEWAIFVDKATYKKYSALPPTEASEILRHVKLDSAGEKYFIVHEGKNCCPLLDADNLCRVQKIHGENYLSQVCASYPRIITRFEKFLEITLSPSCPVAAELILLKREPLQFEVAEASEKILRLGESHILQGVTHKFAVLIFNVQQAMISILQERRLTLDQRLIVLGFFLDRIEELLSGGKLDSSALKKLAEVYTSEKFFAEQVPLMLASVRFDAAAHENFMREVFAELELEFVDDTKRFLPNHFAMIAENFLVNEIFLNCWVWRVDASIANNFGVFVTIYKIFERLTCTARSVDEILSAASNLSRKVDHSDDYLLKISALLDGDDMLSLTDKLLRGETS